MTIIEEMVKTKKEEFWERYLKTEEDILDYLLKLNSLGRLIVCVSEGRLVGYCEYTVLNSAQFGEVILTDELPIEFFDPKGEAIFVTNLHICDRYRGLGAVRYFRDELFNRNPEAKYICGQHQGKRLKPVAVFRRR